MNALVMAFLVTAAPGKSAATVSPVETTSAQGWAVKTSWHDGVKARTIFESSTLVAEVTPDEDTKAAVLAAAPEAVISQQFPTVRLWQVKDAHKARQAVSALLPVYFDAATTSARKRVPVGGVNVFVKKTLSAAQREALQAELQATVADSGMWKVPCEGVKAIALAQTLGKRSEIDLAVPNWWLPPSKR